MRTAFLVSTLGARFVGRPINSRIVLFFLGAAFLSSWASAFDFVQISDTHIVDGLKHANKLRSYIQYINDRASEIDFVLFTGDLTDQHGSPGQMALFKGIVDELDVPYYLVPGNHDTGFYSEPKWRETYLSILGKDYYSFDHEGIRFVCVNSGLWARLSLDGADPKSAEHLNWLRATLSEAANRQIPVIVAGHLPMFLEMPDEPDDLKNRFYWMVRKPLRNQLLEMFESTGVIAYLSGHTHEYADIEHSGIRFTNCPRFV